MFQEREETVKYDIFNAYITILQQTKPFINNNIENNNEPIIKLLKSQINQIIRSIKKLLKDRSNKTRQGCFGLLTQLVNVLPGALNNHIPIVVFGVNYSLK